MSGQSLAQNRTYSSLPGTVSGNSALLRISRRDSYFGYVYYAYAQTSGRCFAPGRFCQE